MGNQDTPWRRSAGLLAKVVIAVLLLLAVMTMVTAVRVGGWTPGHSEDFQWSPAHWFARGIDPYDAYLRHTHAFLLTQYPNYLHLLYVLLVPFGMLPFSLARVLWALANVVMLAAAALVAGRRGGLGVRGQLVLLGCTMVSAPAYYTVAKGQQSALVLLLCVLSFGRGGIAGGTGLALAFAKYSFAPPMALALVIRRRWTALLTVAATSLGALAVFVLVTGTGPAKALWEPFRVSRIATVEGVGDVMTLSGLLPMGSRSLWTYAIAMALCLALCMWGRRTLRGGDAMEALALAFLISLACFMHWAYDYCVLVPVAVVAVRRRGFARAVLLAVVAWFWIGWSLVDAATASSARSALTVVSFLALLAGVAAMVSSLPKAGFARYDRSRGRVRATVTAQD